LKKNQTRKKNESNIESCEIINDSEISGDIVGVKNIFSDFFRIDAVF